ncbi:MAG TPA: alkaline phosphatase family protein [Ktedonobacteraceae bacterium]|nr:alkaline phosphatase family protein [Ktedonobacteraceae bacterium]
MPRRTTLLARMLFALLLGAAFLVGCNSKPSPSSSIAPTTPATRHHAIQTVFLIVMENQNWSQIKGNPSAPYINHTLLPMASYAQQYYNPPNNHPSLPNYLWLEAGTNFGISNDNGPYLNYQNTTRHLVTLLNNAHISWKAYEEGIDGLTCPLIDIGEYTARHNPMIYFNDVTNDNNTHSSYCIAHERPFSQLSSDLAHNSEARYNFITPSLCDDMHTACSPYFDTVRQGDTWLSRQIPMIMNSTAYKDGGAIFITWDEASSGDGPIGMIVLSPDAKGHGYSNSIYYTHSSTLRTVEEIFGVTPLLGAAAHATDLSDLFRTFP